MKNKLNFKLTEKNGNYGIIFNEAEPIAYAMFQEEDYSLAVAFPKGGEENHSKGDILVSVFMTTDVPYGMYNYFVTENDAIFNAHYKKYTEVNN